MLSKRIFETEFTAALNEELVKRGMTIPELADFTGIPISTLDKISLGERDPRLSTIKRIVAVLEPVPDQFIAIIAAQFLLDILEIRDVDLRGTTYGIRRYSSNSFEECIIAAARAEKEGASGIICAPVLASIVEKIVDIPVGMFGPEQSVVSDAIKAVVKRIG